MAIKFNRPEPFAKIAMGNYKAHLHTVEAAELREWDKAAHAWKEERVPGVRFWFFFGQDQEGKPIRMPLDVKNYIGLSKNPSRLVKTLRQMSPGVTDEVLKDDAKLNALLTSLVNREYYVSVKVNDKGYSNIDAVMAPPVAQSLPGMSPVQPVAPQPPAQPDYVPPSGSEEVTFDDDDIPF